MLKWVGGSFDSPAFSLADVIERLAGKRGDSYRSSFRTCAGVFPTWVLNTAPMYS